jgi:HPr kinase/phosphorylase
MCSIVKPVNHIHHATAVAILGDGVLLIGPSGSGKSDLALRLIDRGAILVSDDAVLLEAGNLDLCVCAAPNIEGRLEVRNVGIIRTPHCQSAVLRLVVELGTCEERLPADTLSTTIAGFAVPLARLNPFEASAAIKVEHALRSVVDGGQWPVSSLPAGPQERSAS